MNIEKDMRVTDTAVRLYLLMRHHREPGSSIVWMSLPKLMELVGRQSGLTRKSLLNLEETGWIERIEPERPTQPMRYVINESPAALSTAA